MIRLTMEIGMSSQSISSGSCILAEIIQQHGSSKTCFVAVTFRVDAHLGRGAFAFSGMLIVSHCFEDIKGAHEFVQGPAASLEMARTLEQDRNSPSLQPR